MKTSNMLLRQILTFLIITCFISAVIFIWMFSGAKNNMTTVFLMMWAPGISAFITSWIYKESIRSYGWKPRDIRAIGYALVIPVVVSFASYGFVWLTGAADFTTRQVVYYKWSEILGYDLPAPFYIGLISKLIFASLAAFIVVTGEEIGWSGFLVPKLNKIISVYHTGLLTGLLWSIWHYPAIIGGFYGSGAPLWIALPGFTLALMGASILRALLVERSGTLWTGAVLHISHNVIFMGIFYEMTIKGEYTSWIVSETGLLTGLFYFLTSSLLYRIQSLKPAVLDKLAHKR